MDVAPTGTPDPVEPSYAVAPSALDERHAADIAALHAVADFTAEDPESHLTVLLEAGCGVLDADIALLLTGDGPRLTVRVAAGPRVAHAPAVGEQLTDRRVSEVLQRGQTVASLSAPAAASGSDLGPGVVVASPVTVGGRVSGAIAFTAGPSDPFTARQLALVDLVADGASRILERQADHAERLRLETRARAAIELIPDPVVRVRRDGQRLALDDGRVLGAFDPCGVVGSLEPSAPSDVVDADVVDRVRTTVASVLDSGRLTTEVFASGPERSARRVEARFVPAAADEALCIVRDITDRYRGEVALAEQLAFEALATSISTELIGSASDDLDAAIERGLGEIATFFAADVAYIDEMTHDGSALQASYQWSRKPIGSWRRGGRLDVEGHAWLVEGLAAERHVFIRSSDEMPAKATETSLADIDDKGALWLRLGYGGELVGVLTLTWRTHEPPLGDDVLGLIHYAADAFLGAIRRRTVSLLADGQAEVFELIARGAPIATALASARSLVKRHVLGAEVVIATVDDAGRLDLVAGPHEPTWNQWFRSVEPSLATPFGQAVATGEPVLVADVAGDPRFDTGSLPSAGLRSAALYPVRSPRSGQTLAVVAVLGHHSGAPHLRPSVRDSVVPLVTVAVERSLDERRLAFQATHDPLTGVANRAALIDRLDLALARSRRSGRPVAVLFCDLDGFKGVNDRYGHDRGDRLLVEVANRIVSAVRPSDTVCRTGGDEFVVVCEDLSDARQSEEIVGRVRNAIESHPIDLEEAQLEVRASVGVSVADAHVDDAERVVRSADLAMYAIKKARAGRTGPQRDAALATPVAPSVIDLGTGRLSRPVVGIDLLAAEFDAGFHSGQLGVVHQPLVGRDGTLAGVEALVCWDHPHRGQLRAGRVLAAIGSDPERHALLGRWIRREALASRARCNDSFGIDAPVHVNVAGIELEGPGFLAALQADLDQAGVGPDAMVLEVAERDLAGDTALTVLADLARAGIAVIVDGAGEGGLPLTALADLPVRGIKIGAALVARISEHDPHGVEVVRSLVLLAHGLGWQSMAVGVETEHQRAVLFGFGVRCLQGRAVAMPVSADGLSAWLAGRSR